MKYKIEPVNLEAYNLPLFKEQYKVGKPYIFFGENNLFPLYLVDLFNQSAVHNAIITGKCKYITGRGLVLRRGANPTTKKFVVSPNPYETLDDIFRKCALDFEIHNGFCLKVVRAARGNKVSEVYHLDWTKVRRSAEDKNVFLVSDEWESRYSKADNRKPNHSPESEEYPLFDPNGSDKVSLIYFMEYRPDGGYYPYPEYVGAIPQIETTTEIAKFDLNSIKNGFSGGTIINMLNGYPENDEEAEAIERDVIEKLTGSSNANRVLLNFAEDRDHATYIEQLNGNDLAERYSTLEDRVMQHIFIGHKVVSPMLFGVRSEGQLGGRREILEAYELFKETYALHRQSTLIGVLNSVLEFVGGNALLMVEELKPINPRLPLSDEEVARLISDDAKKAYIQNTYGVQTIENTPAQENVVMSEVALEEEESILRYLSMVGVPSGDYDLITGSHVHSSDDLRDLDYFTLSEDEEEDARLLSQLDGNDMESATMISEAFGWDMNTLLGRIVTLIQAGLVVRHGAKMTITKKAKNMIQLLPESRNNLEIMYEYEVDPTLPAAKKSRRFCDTLMSSGKLYSREDIEGMRNQMKTSFVDDIQDVWQYRGGWYRKPGSDVSVPMCRHRWRQVVVRKKSGNK